MRIAAYLWATVLYIAIALCVNRLMPILHILLIVCISQ